MCNVFRRNYGTTQLCALTSITPKMQCELTIFALIDQENGGRKYVMLFKGSQDFLHTFNMASYYKWGVKNGFAFVLKLIQKV